MNLEIVKPYFFDLVLTMDSEQCPASFFFWKRENGNLYSRLCRFKTAFYRLTLSQTQSRILVQITPQRGQRLQPDAENHARELIHHQFRLEDNFSEILRQVRGWPEIADLFDKIPGLRLMRDDSLFSRVCDSICSQNTSIKHLNHMMENIAIKLGSKVEFDDGTVFYALPTAETVASSNLETLRACGLGYRAKYILQSCQTLTSDPDHWLDLEHLPRSEAEKRIQGLPGVGPKVGALILMFGFGRTDVFPVDVWVQRGLNTYYGWSGSLASLKEKSERRFGDCAAYVNNYIFYAFRKGLVPYREA